MNDVAFRVRMCWYHLATASVAPLISLFCRTLLSHADMVFGASPSNRSSIYRGSSVYNTPHIKILSTMYKNLNIHSTITLGKNKLLRQNIFYWINKVSYVQKKTCLSHEFHVWTRESKWQCKALLQLLAWCIAVDHRRIDVKFDRTLLSMWSLLIAFHNSATHVHSSHFVWSRSAAKNIKCDIDVKVTPGNVT